MNKYRTELMIKLFPFLLKLSENESEDRYSLEHCEDVSIVMCDNLYLDSCDCEEIDECSVGCDGRIDIFAIAGKEVVFLESCLKHITEGIDTGYYEVHRYNVRLVWGQLMRRCAVPDFLVRYTVSSDFSDDLNLRNIDYQIIMRGKASMLNYYRQQVNRAAKELKDEISLLCQGDDEAVIEQTDKYRERFRCDRFCYVEWDDRLLSCTGFGDSSSDMGGYYNTGNAFVAITGDKEAKLHGAGQYDDCGRFQSWDAPTVGQQLYEKKLVPDWIVEYRDDWLVPEQDMPTTSSTNVYKVNKRELASYHRRQINREARKLKTEIEAACDGRRYSYE